MKKVLVVSNTSWSLYNFRMNLMSELENNNFQIITLAPKDKYSKKIKFDHFELKMKNHGTNIFEDLILFYRLFIIYKKINPDLILHFTIKPNIYGTLASKFLGIPCINNITGLGMIFNKNTFLYKFVIFLYKVSQPFATKIFFQNLDDMKLFQKYKIVPKKIMDTVPGSGVNINKFSPIKKNSSKKFVFLFSGRLLRDKGIGEYVEAAEIVAQKYKKTEFHVIGMINEYNPNSVSNDQMSEWIKKGNIKFFGETDNVIEFLKQTDCIVFPSYYREGIPKTLLEAASMEIPIITTNNIGCKDVVDDGINGFICKTKDINNLVDKMVEMLKLPNEKRIKMGKKGREKVLTNFDEKIVIKKYINAINEKLNQNKIKKVN